MSDKPAYRSITLETVDKSIKDWFDVTVDAHVTNPNGELKKVPVRYASGERWVTGKTKKAFRDDNGVLILPVISIRRSNIERDVTKLALGTETPSIKISRIISEKSNNLQNLYKNRAPQFRGPDSPIVYEITTIPFPDRSVLTYELKIQTQYISQMNSVLEKIFNQLDIQNSFMAPFDNYKRQPQVQEPFESRTKTPGGYVVGFMESGLADGGNLEEFTDQERIIMFSTTFTVPVALNLDPQGAKPAIKTTRTSIRMGFGKEGVHLVEPADADKFFGKK